jgi:hypothetical protein
MSQEQRWGHRERPIEITIISLILVSLPVINILGWLFYYIFIGDMRNIIEVIALNLGTFSHGGVGIFYSVYIIGLWVGFLILAWGILQREKVEFLRLHPPWLRQTWCISLVRL